MITQLRPFYTEEERAAVYAAPYDHTTWPDHIERVETTASLLDTLARETGAQTVADLSCGDGAIIAQSEHSWDMIYTADLVPTVGMWRVGPIEQTIQDLPYVDVFLCSETLEHVEDPGALLKSIRKRAGHLVLTTPDGEIGDRNREHYWGWDKYGIAHLLDAAGWDGSVTHFRPAYADAWYAFQMWTCS